MNRAARALLLVLATLLVSLLASGPALAWKGAAAGRVVSIAEVREKGEIGDRVTIEATIIRVKKNRLYEVRDASGEMIVLIPEHVRRESGTPSQNQIVRLSGAFDREKLGKSIEGIRVQSMELLGDDSGASGAASDTKSAGPARIERPAPAGDSDGSGSAQVMQPEIDKEWIRKLREARQALDAAANESQDASAAYARALHQAGSPDAVDSEIRDREARSRVINTRARSEVARLVSEARAAGVPANLLRLYEQATLDR